MSLALQHSCRFIILISIDSFSSGKKHHIYCDTLALNYLLSRLIRYLIM